MDGWMDGRTDRCLTFTMSAMFCTERYMSISKVAANNVLEPACLRKRQCAGRTKLVANRPEIECQLKFLNTSPTLASLGFVLQRNWKFLCTGGERHEHPCACTAENVRRFRPGAPSRHVKRRGHTWLIGHCILEILNNTSPKLNFLALTKLLFVRSCCLMLPPAINALRM
jgi:hypothetical protein